MGRIRRVVSAALSILLALAAGAGFGWFAHTLGSAVDPFLLAALFSGDHSLTLVARSGSSPPGRLLPSRDR